MHHSLPEPLIRKVDAIQIHVPDLDAGLRFYRDLLGHEIIWRTEQAIGLRLPDSDAELVIQTGREGLELNLLVASVEQAVERIVQGGGTVLVAPFDTLATAPHNREWIRMGSRRSRS